MSKSKGNFPDPQILFDKYGVDALRFYMLSSPLMKSEDLNFSEKGVDEIYKKNILRMKNVVSFFEMYEVGNREEIGNHPLDRWIVLRLNQCLSEVTDAMEIYKIDQAHGPLSIFIDDLSTWYLRRSRDRMKEDSPSQEQALSTLRYVLKNFAMISAPLMPFLSEEIYQKFRNTNDPESVHLANWPEKIPIASEDERLIENMSALRALATLALEARAKAQVKVRQPLKRLKIKDPSLNRDTELIDILREEINVKEIVFDETLTQEIDLDTELDSELKKEGDFREVVRAIQEARKQKGLTPKDLVTAHIVVNKEWKSAVEDFQQEIKKICNLSDIKISDDTSSENFVVTLE